MSPSIAHKTLQLLRHTDTNIPEKMELPQFILDLSRREVEVLQQLAQGYNYAQIGEQLYISKNTVKKHIRSIYQKLHVSSKTQAIKLPRHYGIL